MSATIAAQPSPSRAAALAVCEHGEELAQCRDAQTPEVRSAVDFAHSHAYAYAYARLGTSAIESLDDAEEFATYISRDVARRDGDLDGDLRCDLERWMAERAAS